MKGENMVGHNGQSRQMSMGQYDEVDFDHIARAMRLAMDAHHCQPRKSDGTPYIFHPLAVGRIVAEVLARSGSYDSDVICAGILHDVCEDGGVTLDWIQRFFGARVAKMVATLTEDKIGTWFQRKAHTVEEIGDWTEDEQLIKLADVIDNLISTAQQLAQAENPDEVWKQFKQGLEFQWWYNFGMYRNIRESGFSHQYLLDQALELILRVWPDLMASLPTAWQKLNGEVAVLASGIK